MPAVVAITGTVTTSSSGYGYFGSGSAEASTSGTGIIIGENDTELLIVTNAHVVDGVSNLKVTFNDNEAVTATVKGSKTDKDIAVVAVKISDLKESTVSSIAIAELGDSDSIQVGESVVAIGNALGEGQSVTVGWVSALNRSITVEDTQYSNLIMTDAAINPGNSGGALLNASGQVIGINAAKYSSTGVEGMGYAIPISSVKDIIDNLSTKQTKALVDASKASYLGISGIDVTSASSITYNVPEGVMINQVASGSPAEKAGLVKQDIIVSFDGEDITSFTGLKSLMQYYATGDTVTIVYYHYISDSKTYETKETQVQVTLGRATKENSIGRTDEKTCIFPPVRSLPLQPYEIVFIRFDTEKTGVNRLKTISHGSNGNRRTIEEIYKFFLFVANYNHFDAASCASAPRGYARDLHDLREKLALSWAFGRFFARSAIMPEGWYEIYPIFRPSPHQYFTTPQHNFSYILFVNLRVP